MGRTGHNTTRSPHEAQRNTGKAVAPATDITTQTTNSVSVGLARHFARPPRSGCGETTHLPSWWSPHQFDHQLRHQFALMAGKVQLATVRLTRAVAARKGRRAVRCAATDPRNIEHRRIGVARRYENRAVAHQPSPGAGDGQHP